MGWRTVIVNSRAKLELKNNYLVIRGDTVKRVFVDEISVLVIENTGISLTVSLLECLWIRKVCVIFCDRKRFPGAQLVPYYNSFDCSLSLVKQINWKRSFMNAVWAKIVEQKILNQAVVLKKQGKVEPYNLLMDYAKNVEIADMTNREGHAAKVYFNALFGKDFSRKDFCYENACLNYGYGVLLSVVSREIVANGYVTQLGIFHSSVYNQFNLACDFMEPFRPIFDLHFFNMESSENRELSHQNKMSIINVLNSEVYMLEKKYTLLDALSIYVKRMLDTLEKEDLSLIRFINNEF